MRTSRVAVRLLVAVLALLMLHSAAQGQTGRAAQVYQMAGTCSVEVRPDAAVIIGGVAAGGLQPVEAVDRLEKQLALVRGYLDSNRGQLQLLERVRTLRNSPARPQDTEPPFQVVQRLRAELPVNAPIDQILQRLIELGLDRFGDDVLNTGGSRREPVVRFVIRDLDTKLAELQQSCATAAWKAWCLSTPDVSGLCTGDKPPFELPGTELQRPIGGESPPARRGCELLAVQRLARPAIRRAARIARQRPPPSHRKSLRGLPPRADSLASKVGDGA